jgi:hypothetical protein
VIRATFISELCEYNYTEPLCNMEICIATPTRQPLRTNALRIRSTIPLAAFCEW